MPTDAIRVVAQLSDAALDVAHVDPAFNVDRTGEGKLQVEQTLGTSNEALTTLSDIGTPGWGYFENMDDTNRILIATQDDAVYFADLYPGEKFPMPLATATLYAKGSAGTPVLRYTVLER